VPLEVTDGSAKQCWVAGQRPFEVSNCPFTQVAMASWTHVVSPSMHRKQIINKYNFNNLVRGRLVALTSARTCCGAVCHPKLGVKLLGL
jgi:hypothetical protein